MFVDLVYSSGVSPGDCPLIIKMIVHDSVAIMAVCIDYIVNNLTFLILPLCLIHVCLLFCIVLIINEMRDCRVFVCCLLFICEII